MTNKNKPTTAAMPNTLHIGGAQNYAITDDETLVDAAQVRGQILGGRSDMWLNRRLRDPGSGFPKPMVIANRRYWKLGQIRAWIAAQAGKGRTRGPATAGVVLLLLLPVPPAERQIWASWTPRVTLACDPEPERDLGGVASAPRVFPRCGTPVSRAGVRPLPIAE